jgi:hypothetical protein
MTDDRLAHWLSEYPKLIDVVQRSPEMAKYLTSRRPNPKYVRPTVSEETWKKITEQLK